MSGVIATESTWLKNFTTTAHALVQDQKAEGYLVQGFIMTVGIYDKLSKAIGYEPNDFLGYVIEILEQTEEEFEKEGEMMFVKCKALN